MTDATYSAAPEAEYSRRLRPLRAARAFGRLVRNKEDTAQVFEIMRALVGRSMERGYKRLAKTPAGAAAIAQRQELAQLFSDRTWLSQFEPDTVGAAYLAFLETENLSAEGLVAESIRGESVIQADHPYAWYARRLRDVHDLWHVLTGYGRDALGEACVVSFSYAQTGSLGFGFIGLAAAHEVRREDPVIPARKAVMEAWRWGRRAAWLPALDYPALLAEPLEGARSRLGVSGPTLYAAIPRSRLEALSLRAGNGM
jgi:ubiquinone biosynthesis protein COQ4